MRRTNSHELGPGEEQRQGFRVSRVAQRHTGIRIAARAGRRRDAENAAIRGEVAEWKSSQTVERRGPGKACPKAVEKGAHGRRVRAGWGGPYGGIHNVQARSRRELLRGERHRSHEACQVRVEHLAIIRAPVPGRGQDGGAMQQEGPYPRVEVGSGLSDGTDGRPLSFSGFEETSAEDQTSLGDKSAESKAKPGPFGSTGRRPECGKGWPSEGDLVRFSKQGTHGT